MTTWISTERWANTRRRVAAGGCAGCTAASRRAYTLIEVLVVTAIITILLAVAAVSWQQLSSSEREAQAINTIVSYASVARTHAMQHQVETVLAIDTAGSLHLYEHGVAPGGDWWDADKFREVTGDVDALPEGVVAAPMDSANLDSDGQGGKSWVALCFDSSGRLICRQVALLRASGSYPPAFTSSYGVKTYRPERLVAYAGKQVLDDVNDNDLKAFLSDYTTTGLWQAVALNQWSAQPLPME